MTIQHLITQLEQSIHQAYQSGNKYDFIDSAQELCQELYHVDKPFEAVEPLFLLIERSPDVDYGGPGPIGGFLESFCGKGYEEALMASIRRKPTVYTLYLLQAAITDNNDPRQVDYFNLMVQAAGDMEHPEHIRREAREHLQDAREQIFQSSQALISSLQEAEKLLEVTQALLTEKRQQTGNEQPPFPEMLFGGIRFKVINREQAKTFIPTLTDMPGIDQLYDVYDEWRFPVYYDNGFFLLAEEDVATDKFEMNYGERGKEAITILGFIFLKNLAIRLHLLAFDTDNSPVLIVHGSLQCPNIHLFGNRHYIGGEVIADLIWAQYNHGELYLNGDVSARAVFANDMPVFIRQLSRTTALVSQTGMNIYTRQANGAWLQQPGTHDLEAVLLTDLFTQDNSGDSMLDDEKALMYLKTGKTLLQTHIHAPH